MSTIIDVVPFLLFAEDPLDQRGTSPAEGIRDMLQLDHSQSLKRATLRLRTRESLLRTAEASGFHLVRDREGLASDRHLLMSASGDRVVLSRNQDGRIEMSAASGSRAIERLVRAHTRERAVEHLRARGMTVREAVLPGGEVQILAEGASAGQPARISVQVHQDGTYWADVDKTKGPACVSFVQDLADATGGEIVTSEFKDAYFARPLLDADDRVQV